MQLIDIQPSPSIPPAQVIAQHMLHRVNASLAERVHEHKAGFRAFWDSPEAPDDILAAMGDKAAIMLATAGENVDHIGRLAAIVGKTVEDFLPAEHWQPRREFVVAQDGTVTLAPPADGYDAWGREIPQPEPEPEPQPEPEPII